ncbi:MAG: MFS transporter [Deltaproteobacteria bacterium]|nr:MFS transporter [Deltaproteobacteria bacterium]
MTTEAKKHPLREILDPFIDLAHAPRALWGINFPYFLEGFVYFGMLGYLAMFFNQSVGLGDTEAGPMVGVLTWGITFAMFLFGGLADKWGVRLALLLSFVLMIIGRAIVAAGPSFGLPPAGMWSAVHLVTLFGILFIVTGYGMYMPAAYAAVRQFTNAKSAGMAYAMLYALMNLGGWLPTFFSPVRKAIGIAGSYWVFASFTIVSLLVTFFVLSKKTVAAAIERAKKEREEISRAEGKTPDAEVAAPAKANQPFSVWGWLKAHPLADPKFAFFIFCLIPVQTLFAHNWLTLPMYVERAYKTTWPWISENFEPATNFNPLLIFILVPIVTALTEKAKVYNMMIAGTFVMAVPTFLLAIGPYPWTLTGFLVLMTVGEAMWQPRFLQYAAEIAPEGRTGAYMGVAQFPWFLTKVITSLYSGWFLLHYCPDQQSLETGVGVMATERMWLIYGFVAISSTVMLVLARGWLGKDFKTKAA